MLGRRRLCQSRLRPALPLLLTVRYNNAANAIYRMSPKLPSMDKANKIWLPWQRPLPDRKTNFKLISWRYSSTNPGNLAKIGPVD